MIVSDIEARKKAVPSRRFGLTAPLEPGKLWDRANLATGFVVLSPL